MLHVTSLLTRQQEQKVRKEMVTTFLGDRRWRNVDNLGANQQPVNRQVDEWMDSWKKRWRERLEVCDAHRRVWWSPQRPKGWTHKVGVNSALIQDLWRIKLVRVHSKVKVIFIKALTFHHRPAPITKPLITSKSLYAGWGQREQIQLVVRGSAKNQL